METILRTDSTHPGFRALVTLLDKDLQIRDGEDHSFYAQFNKIDKIKHVVVAYKDDVPVGCGAIREYQTGVTEVKRMFVKPEFRGQGIARQVLTELEKWARELNYTACILETGKKQPEAIRLYQKAGYTIIPNYGQYKHVDNSVCMQKDLN
ncbi:GNAT family N-acetyltransferase [Pontibacter ruber]|uniref:GNAT family N-acetyltransferase n=1 Tax=Pontibacter ruber TaxID=1343895 RepID=A0ABW5D1L9_9BACT|nr:GNAT family N-acetyltransferase [Pontibacter ruber]